MVGPAMDVRIEKGAVNNELPAPVEKIEQRSPSLWSLKYILILDGDPRHAPARRSQGISRTGMFLLLNQHLLPGFLPFSCRDYRGLGHLCDLLIGRHLFLLRVPACFCSAVLLR